MSERRSPKPAVTVVCNDADYFMRHRLAVVEQLASLGFAVTVLTGGRAIPSEAQRGWKHDFMPIERFSFSPLGDFALLFRTLNRLYRDRPRYVHLITLKPAVFSGLAAVLCRSLCGMPQHILVTIPGLGRLMSPLNEQRGLGSAIARRIVETAVRFLSTRPGLLFTFETRHDREHWLARGLVTEGKSVVINGAGVDPGQFYPSHNRRSQGPPKILFASRLLYAKGLDVFVEVARRFSGRSGCAFIVAGIAEPGDPDSYTGEMLAGEAAIRFLGEVTDMPALLREVDLVCLPTRYGEGIPRILIEAAATGLPSIATDLPGCREIVSDGASGFLFPVADASTMSDAMEAAIATYLDDPKLLAEHGQAAVEVFRAGEFSQHHVTERFVSLIVGGEISQPVHC